MPRQDCDAVEGFLAVGGHVVPGRFDRLARKGVLEALDLLEAQHVRLGVLEERREMVEPLLDGIDVPSGHRDVLSGCRALPSMRVDALHRVRARGRGAYGAVLKP